MSRVARTRLGVMFAALSLSALPACGGTMPEPHPALAKIANERTLKLTTVGRKTGKPRTAAIWFVVDGGRIFVQAGEKARNGWLANVRSNPGVTMEVGGMKLEGRATIVSDEAEARRVLGLIRQKYWLARVAGWVGSSIGAGVPVRIELEKAVIGGQ